jgi:hypothetical protein
MSTPCPDRSQRLRIRPEVRSTEGNDQAYEIWVCGRPSVFAIDAGRIHGTTDREAAHRVHNEAVIDTREPVGSQGSGKVVYAVWSSVSVRWGSRAWWRLAAAMLAWPSRRRG